MSSGDLDQFQQLTMKAIQDALRQTSHLRVNGHRSTDDGLLVALDLDTSEFDKVEGGPPCRTRRAALDAGLADLATRTASH